MAMFMAMSLGVLAMGCGKTEEEKMVDSLQKEYGMSEEEAEFTVALAEGMGVDLNEKETEKSAELTQEEQRIASFELVEPKSEILNSTMKDTIIQIEDKIIPFDGSKTVGEVIEEIQSCYDYPLTVKKDQKEITADALQTKCSYFGSSVLIENDLGDDLFWICYLIEDNTSASVIYDLPVIDIEGFRYSLEALNVFYPGNICLGVYNDSEQEMETEQYKTRLAEYPVLTYAELEDYLVEKGLDYEFWGADAHVNLVRDEPVELNGESYYLEEEITFFVDESDGKVSNVSRSISTEAGDNIKELYVKAEEVPEDLFEEIVAEGAQSVLDGFYVDATSAEVVAYVQEEDRFILIYKTDKDEYAAVTDVDISQRYNGEYRYSDLNYWGMLSASLDKLLQEIGHTEEDCIFLED